LFGKIREYNTWNSKLSDTGYQRHIYLERIKSYLGSKLIKVMVGQRRTGKSFILRQLINYLITQLKVEPANVFYLNKEFLAFDKIQTASDLEQLFQLYKVRLRPAGKI